MWRLIAPFLLPLIAVSHVSADTFILKDGKQIEGVILKDTGDAYEIESDKGARQTLKKADVEKILPTTREVLPPLTGASFTFDKKKRLTYINLLANLDLKKSVVQGNWTMKGAELQVASGVDTNCRLSFATTVPEEYDLALELSRKNGDGDFEIGLVVGGKQGVLALDAVGGTVSAFCLEGKALDASSGVAGRFFTNGVARSVVCMVRKNGVVVLADGKDFLSLQPSDLPKLCVPSVHAVPSRDALFIVCWKGTYSVTKAVLSSPKN
jgi:hypothetical protein